MAERYFTLFHYSLLQIRQLDIESRRELDREGWIRFVLSKPFEFPYHGGSRLVWVPRGNLEECIYGLIQRQVEHVRHLPPVEGGDEVIGEEWQGAYVIIDPTDHNLGQRVAVENDMVGKPVTLMRYFFKAINDRFEAPFVAEVAPIFDSATFWTFVKKNGENLRFIRFRFFAPNMWGVESELEKELKDTREDTGAERVDIKFSGEEGVVATSKRVSQGVAYAERGSGTVYARAKNGARYTSEAEPKRTSIITSDGRIGLRFLYAMKNTILGRE
jgi:RNA polymerase subunit RPABC4/transcription elongation factor Spt4